MKSSDNAPLNGSHKEHFAGDGLSGEVCCKNGKRTANETFIT